MQTIIKWFKNIKFKIFLKLYHKTHSLTPKGEAVMYYILNKYVNSTKENDFIENYELSITKKDARFIEAAKHCVELDPTLGADIADVDTRVKAIAHIFSALYMFTILMVALPAKHRDEWYDRILDDEMRERVYNGVSQLSK